MDKKIIVLVNSPQDTQKILNQWLSQGYEIKILAQTALSVSMGVGYDTGYDLVIVTTVERIRK